jgi:hypothetical protein
MSTDWRFWSRPGGTLLAASATLLLLMLLFGCTPLFWILTGRQSESYPELMFLALGVPIAAFLTALSGVLFWRKNSNARHS